MSYDWQKLMDEANEGGGFEALPPSTYDVQCVGATVKKTKAGDKDMIVAQLKVIGGPQNGKVEWNNFTLSPDNPNAMRFFFQHMGAFGLRSDFFAVSPSLEQIAGALVGKQVRIETGHRLVDGATRTDITKIMPPGAGTVAPPITTSVQAAAQPQPAPVAQPAPQPAPAPVQPVVQPQPAPQPQPQPQPAPVQGVPVDSSNGQAVSDMTPEQQAALLQQLLAQQAAATQAQAVQPSASEQVAAAPSGDEPPRPPF